MIGVMDVMLCLARSIENSGAIPCLASSLTFAFRSQEVFASKTLWFTDPAEIKVAA